MADLIEYKCPACGGALEFNTAIQKMKCPYCDSEYSMDELAAKDEELNKAPNEVPLEGSWDMSAAETLSLDEASGLCSYVCHSCGGEIVGDAAMAATKCPFCDNPVVMTQQFSGMLKPDYVIPFKLDKKAAKEALSNHLKGKRLLPRVFKSQNHIDEIKGIYVPFWLFDAGANARIMYQATRVRHWSDRDYNYTETSYFDVMREGSLVFDNIPVDGSTKMADELMESIEPFDFSQAVDFQTAYLAGYFADKYDVASQDCAARANARVRASTERALQSTVIGYDSVMPTSSNIRLYDTKAKYALYPVWLLNTTWQGKKYVFAMNGQTGKFVGDLPADKSAAVKWFLGTCAGVMAAAYAVMYLLWML